MCLDCSKIALRLFPVELCSSPNACVPFPYILLFRENPYFATFVASFVKVSVLFNKGSYFTVRTYRQRNPQRSQQLSPSSRDVSRSGGSRAGCGRQRSGMANGCPERTGRPLQAHKKQKELVGVPLPWNWDLYLQIIFPCTSRCLGVKEKCLECFGLDTSFFSSASATSGDMSLPGDDNINFCLMLSLTILILLWQARVLLTGVLPSLTPWELAL